jgi:pimeloyl-ACP methyl ester carboxylesterase
VQTVEVDGLRIAYRRAGAGPTLVLLHGGFGFDSRSWRRQLADLSDRLTVVAWDAPGCGGSEDPPEWFRLPEYADCLAGFVAALGLPRPHVLGLSFGAAMALQLFDRHPELPRSLVLAGGYAGWAGSLSPEEVQRRLDRLLRESELPPSQWIPDYLPGMLAPTAPPDLAEEVLDLMSGVRPSGNKAMLLGMAEADLRPVLPRIDVPTLLLHGDQDARSPLSVARELHAAIPASRLVVLPGVGHLSNLEGADRFDAEVRAFLQEVEDPEAR